MASQDVPNTDDSSIKPVSSLRSHFESMIKGKPGDKPPPLPPPRPSPSTSSTARFGDARPAGRMSLDQVRPAFQPGQQLHSNMASLDEKVDSRPATPKRPLSMGPHSPVRSPPLVTIDSPKSPARIANGSSLSSFYVNARAPAEESSSGSRPHSPIPPTPRTFKIPSRTGTPTLDSSTTPSLQSPVSLGISLDPRKGDAQPAPVPPPINRAVKPKIFQTPARGPSDTLAAPPATADPDDEKISPFSTPPSEAESPLQLDSPPPIPDYSKPRPNFRLPLQSHFPRASEADNAPRIPPRPSASDLMSDAPDRGRELPPSLPPRRDVIRPRSPRPPPPPPDLPRRSNEASRAINLQAVPSPHERKDRSRSREGRALIPPRRPNAKEATNFPPPPRHPRFSGESKREPIHSPNESDDEDDDHSPERSFPAPADFPDTSQANRRPPRFRERPHEIHTKYETKLFALCGEVICTTGYITRAWNIRTGEQLMSISHGETIKATAIAFKPAKAPENDSKRLWIGTNIGELHEIDIATQSVIMSKTNAHSRNPITRIHRQASNLWTIDEEGRLLVWPAEDGAPSLGLVPHQSRIFPKSSFSLLMGNKLWVALGRDLWVYEQNIQTRAVNLVTTKPLAQPNVGEVNSGAIVSGQADRVYFGHNDGKVTIYSKDDHSCLGVVGISLYKISTLVGVGNYLWAGFSTGMIYVYDMGSQPWKVLKDWRAHENIIAGIQVDHTSVWKLDRLQVASLGSDGALRLWDGLLMDDWLERDLRDHDVEYCDFAEITAAVLTWNAGASKPSSLRHDERDENFFREYLRSTTDPADILVFGFQELVDLEDKKVTAKSFFKSSKKKDEHTQEHMSHQYRAWRDYLARAIDETMPKEHTYQLLHTSSMIGLFTCIFVKDALRPRVRALASAQIKLGMGGLHGNKGGLLARFLVDDTSLCFANCHLAAGQRRTRQRNNDAAAVVEATALDPLVNQIAGAAGSDLCVGGGDGTMFLDHEVCVLAGDLNYRIDSTPRAVVEAAVKAGQLARLLACDQLLGARKRNPGFRLRALEEKAIDFAPTYKYDVGSDVYDTSEKRRAPAWCDRVLYRGVGCARMEKYRRWEVRTSDHRPVSGVFRIRVKTVRGARRERVVRDGGKRFGEAVGRVRWDVQMDYLVNVLGLERKEAAALLAR